MADRTKPDLVRIGQITAPHGVRGAVRVFPLTDFPERFRTLRRVILGSGDTPIGVRYRGIVKNMVIVELDGITDRNQTEALKGQYLQVPRSEVHKLPEGYYYDFDLIGLEVIDPAGARLGQLVHVDHSSPVHDLYVVETAPGKRYMVPAVRQFVQSIDLETGKMVIQPIPGLLED